MDEDRTIGYSKEDYYSISSKEGLPKRCPILQKCCKAVWTRYILGFEVVGTRVPFEEFLSAEGQYWEPEKMIKEVEQMRWIEPDRNGESAFFYADNICPEVTLFEERYLPTVIAPSACGHISYYYESKRSAVEPKHYSECPEFSEYWLNSIGQKKSKVTSVLNSIPEKLLEDYLVNNLELLEPDLKFIERQKAIGQWRADIFASDRSGADVLIELKSKILNREEIDKLCGQASRYFNHLKSISHASRMIIVMPKDCRDIFHNIYHGLKHWIENDKVNVFEFDYNLYGKEFSFSKVNFEKNAK